MGAKTRINELERDLQAVNKVLSAVAKKLSDAEHFIQTLREIPEGAFAIWESGGMRVQCEVGAIIKDRLAQIEKGATQ